MNEEIIQAFIDAIYYLQPGQKYIPERERLEKAVRAFADEIKRSAIEP